jgi:sarcosine oxidase subunit alpha
LEEGAQVVSNQDGIGHATSAYWSETLQAPIALGLIAAGRSRVGELLHVPMPDRTIAVRVTNPVFYDRQGVRLHV